MERRWTKSRGGTKKEEEPEEEESADVEGRGDGAFRPESGVGGVMMAAVCAVVCVVVVGGERRS